MTEASSGSGRIMFVTEVIDSAAGLLESTTSTTAAAMEVNLTTTEAPYNGEESENRLEDLDTFSNMTSEIMTNVTSQMTISDQQDAQQVKILVAHGTNLI